MLKCYVIFLAALFWMETSCTSAKVAIYEKRCTNRTCCQLAAQKKFRKHKHHDHFQHTDERLVEYKPKKPNTEVHPAKF